MCRTIGEERVSLYVFISHYASKSILNSAHSLIMAIPLSHPLLRAFQQCQLNLHTDLSPVHTQMKGHGMATTGRSLLRNIHTIGRLFQVHIRILDNLPTNLTMR